MKKLPQVQFVAEACLAAFLIVCPLVFSGCSTKTYSAHFAQLNPAPSIITKLDQSLINNQITNSSVETVMRAMGTNPPPSLPDGIVPPSWTWCDTNAPVSTALTGCEQQIPYGMHPIVGDQVHVIFQHLVITDVRVVAFDGNRVLGQAFSTTPWDVTGDYPGGVILATYTGAGFRFRAELCVNGKWTPISAPITSSKPYFSYFVANHEYDNLDLAFGSETRKPTASNVSLGLTLYWTAPNVLLETQAIPDDSNWFFHQESTSTGRASLSANGQPYPATTISVRLAWRGNPVLGNPFAPIGPNGSTGGPQPANPPRLDAFPYGGPLSNTAVNTSSVEVSDHLTSWGFPAPDVTSPFTVEAAAVLLDGRRYYGHVSTGN